MNEATIFSAALEKASETDRSAFLDEACAGNQKLRERVEALLARRPSQLPVCFPLTNPQMKFGNDYQ